MVCRIVWLLWSCYDFWTSSTRNSGSNILVTSIAPKSMTCIWISCIDVMYVCSLFPADWLVEIACFLVELPLWRAENTLKLGVALVPIMGVDITVAIDAAQIVEVRLISLLSLPVIQTLFFCHLVCEDACLLDGVIDSLCRNGHTHDGRHYHCHYQSFHNSCSLKGYYSNYFYCIIETSSVSWLRLQRYGDLVGWQREIL